MLLLRVGAGGGGGGGGGLGLEPDMQVPDKQTAIEVAHKLPSSISCMVLELAQERLRAVHASSAALDGRCTQVAAFLLAAAAIAGTMLAGADLAVRTIFCAAISCLLFVVGAAVAFHGVRAEFQHLPGVHSAWWKAALEAKDFSETDARCWIAGLVEDAIKFNCEKDESRARALNWSLRLGVAGGLFVCLAALSRLPWRLPY